MERINQQLNNFENLPDSALDNATSKPFGLHEISEKEIFDTNSNQSGSTPIDEIPSGKKGVSVNKDAQTSSIKLGGLVGGELAVRLLDIAIPSLLVTVIYYIGYKLEKDKIKLNAEDRKVIAPVLTDALNAIEINLDNPFANLALVLGIVYGTKLVEVIPTLEKRKPERKVKDGSFSEAIEHSRVDKEPIEKEPDLKLSPTTLFKEEWNELLKTIMERTGRKSRKGAIGWIYKNEPQLAKDLLYKHGLTEPPDDNDFNWVKSKTPTVNFSL